MKLTDRRARTEIYRAVCNKTKPGPAREVALFQWLYGKKPIPSNREFVESCIKIPHKEDTSIIDVVKLNKPQRHLEAQILRMERQGLPVRLAVLKARQWGITAKRVADLVTISTREPNTRACLLADDQDLAREKLALAKDMIDLLPQQLPMRFSSRFSVRFEKPINSQIDIASATTDDPCRGKTFRILHATEPGIWRNPERKVASVNQAVPSQPGTHITYEGTANGIGNWWHSFWWDARNGKNDYKALFYPWYYDPDFDYCALTTPDQDLELLSDLDDEEVALLSMGVVAGQLWWRRKHIANSFFGDLDLFHQEFPATPEEAFLASGRPVFSREHVMQQVAICEDPIFVGDMLVGEWDEEKARFLYTLSGNPRGDFTVWERPSEGRRYVIGADTGEGLTSGDYSAAYAMDKESMAIVAEWHGKCDPHQFADILSCMGHEYNRAYVLPEIEGPGSATMNQLRSNRYPAMGRRPVFDTPGKRTAPKYGWSTNSKSKYTAVNVLRELIAEKGQLKINSRECCQEMLEWEVQENGTYEPPGGRNDDRIMALVITVMAARDANVQGIPVKDAPRPRNESEAMWAEWEASVEDRDNGDLVDWYEEAI